jgi:hypothetical protein
VSDGARNARPFFATTPGGIMGCDRLGHSWDEDGDCRHCAANVDDPAGLTQQQVDAAYAWADDAMCTLFKPTGGQVTT